MKSYPKKWGKLFERYLDEYLPERKDEICARADREYRKLLTQMPDVGGKENMMASNMETWFSIVAFYEASDHVIDGKAFGTMLLGLPESDAEAARAIEYIQGQPNVTVEEVPYHG